LTNDAGLDVSEVLLSGVEQIVARARELFGESGILADDEARWRTSPLPQQCAGWSEAGGLLGAPGRRVESIIWRGRERLAPGPARRTVTNAARRGPRP
jgi:hypothetical protein